MFKSALSGREATGCGPGNQNSVVDDLRLGLATVLPIKPFDASRGIDELLFASEKRMAIRADLKPDLVLGRASLPRMPAGAVHVCSYVLGVNIRLHAATPVANFVSRTINLSGKAPPMSRCALYAGTL
jgi:hypothetical protein